MKKTSVWILLIISIFTLVSCSDKKEKKDTVYVGVDAEILSINYTDKTLTVVGLYEYEKFLPSGSKLDCKDAEDGDKIFKSKNSTDIEILKFDDLKVSDRIKINIRESELNKEYGEDLVVLQIELIKKN